MGQGYVYVNDVRYSNIFTFAVGIFFVNASHLKTLLTAEPHKVWTSMVFFAFLDLQGN